MQSANVPKKVAEILSRYQFKKFICCISYFSDSKHSQQAIHTIFKPELLIPSQIITPAVYLCAQHCELYIKDKDSVLKASQRYLSLIKKIKSTAKALNISVTVKNV